MELSPFEIYLVMQAGSVKTVLIVALAACSAVLVGFTIAWNDAWEDYKPFHANMIRKIIPVWVVIIMLVALIPSTKTLVAMYSVPVVLEALQSEQVSETTNKALKSVNKLLDTYLGEVEQ